MSKVIFADNSEIEVNDCSSVFAITLDTVDPKEIESFTNKLSNANLKSFRIENPEPSMCSEGKDFMFIEVARDNMFDMVSVDGESVPEKTSTTFLLRPMNETEKKLLKLFENDKSLFESSDATNNAVEELATVVTEMMG